MSEMKSLTSSSVSFTLSFMTPRCCEISLWYFAAYQYFNLPRLWHQIEDCDSGPSHECHLSRVIFPASDWSVLVNPRLWLVDDMSNVWSRDTCQWYCHTSWQIDNWNFDTYSFSYDNIPDNNLLLKNIQMVENTFSMLITINCGVSFKEMHKGR